MTATESPQGDVAGVDRRAEAGHDTAAEQPHHSRVSAGVHLRALPGVDEGLLGKGPDAQRRRELGAVREGHLLGGIEGVEAQVRLAALARPALATHRAPVQDHEVTRGDRRHPRPDRLDRARSLMAEQEGELIVDPALAVGEVGVAHPAGLHLHDHLARSRVRDRDRGDLDRRSLGAGDDAPNLLWHKDSFVMRQVQNEPKNVDLLRLTGSR
ncbi:hypothetical protein MSTO_24180 [Mycobacterium stomatepiae]|uniref:Uncharacterized protein n=1 Tax=Mycobacterium stomatepiae TaxID=470076 RepID=A0A7I7Q7H6_9MYCO|nr:hypothetical protein MSTO_24180 [Mycobacterium stomatepiae]